MTIWLVVAWYDFWVGIYYDRKKRCIYILPVPCIGFCIQLREKR